MERESGEQREREFDGKVRKKIFKKNKIQSYNSSVYLHIAKM